MSDPICFPAQVVKIQTLADGGIRLTLDLPETKILEAAQLMEVKRAQAYGEVEFTPCKTGPYQGDGEKRKNLASRPKRKSEWETEEAPGDHSDS